MTRGRNQQLKARSASFENNILDDSTGSKYNQKFLEDTGSPLPLDTTHLAIAL